MTNPLLQSHTFPPFQQIQPDQIEPAFDQLLADARAELDKLLQDPPCDWTLVQQLEAIEDRLGQAWSPVSHMNSVVNSDELRQAYNAVLPKLTEYHTEMGQNEALFNAYRELADSDGFADLAQSQRTLVEHALRDFRLSGIDLPDPQRSRYGELKKRLSELTSKFSENVLDATNGWSKQLDNKEVLTGLPDSAIDAAAQAAQARELDGYLLTLDFPSYFAVISYADDRELRREVYEAFSTRASDQGPHAGQWDNGPLIDEILVLRHELAQLLGFANYADYSLATKMAESSDQVVGFLRDLASKSRSMAQTELDELAAFAREQDGIDTLEAWDVGYYGDKLRQQRYALSQEQLRPYFPVNKVLDGLFGIAAELFDIEVEAEDSEGLWHPDARRFALKRDGEVIAHFYLDLYARSHKRGGAWMDECRVRRRLDDGAMQLPVAYLVCNFNPPVGDQPALLTHNEVTTLFHEFGHGLHHMLTRIEWAGVSGINGVAWDAVELPSQFLENWCWEPQALARISGHFETGEPLPAELLEAMLAAKNFQSGMLMVRQLEFSLFDFLLHRDYQPASEGQSATDVQALLNQVRAETAVVQAPAFNRFQHGFSHIFAGGYAAGYYSYKWAEVLSADAFSRFEEEGVFNKETGRSFLHEILEQGGSREPMALFKAFRGREPEVDALLRHSGIPAAGDK
ncbi:oligopeptidase A [Motiliproteus coralliicola]|uniref:oligopeptidase A n=1 Tax=Motiliproteus coralliicola TaxID=2283196 RepID=A0A369WC43_9GAMM|nr:oligopeptidase A [Motiliproteus coralliicola]RDE18883.1 oligopeptidase A [Motiliproteus coralliicola]